YENEIRIHHHSHRVVADRSIRTNTACAGTAAATAVSAGNARSSRETSKGSGNVSRCGQVAGTDCRESPPWFGEGLRVGCRLCKAEQPRCYCWRSTERHPQNAKRPNSDRAESIAKASANFPARNGSDAHRLAQGTGAKAHR